MHQQTIPVNASASVLIHPIHGDLRVAGWDRPEIMVKTDGEELTVASSVDPIEITCDEDLIIYLPRSINLKIEKIAGDAVFQALSGPLTLGPVKGDVTMNDLGPISMETISGDASLKNVGTVNAGSISGDFTLRGGHGICAVDDIGGDGSIRDVDGMLTISNVGADLFIRNVNASITANAGADVALYLVPQAGQVYDITAGDDILLRLPPDANVRLHLTASEADSIQVDFPGIELPEDCTSCEVLLGEKKDNLPDMLLTAGSDLLVTNQAEAWKSASDFDSGNWRIPPIPPIPPLPADFSDRIKRRVEASMERAQAHIEAASRRTEARVQAAARRAEMKARAADVRGRRAVNFDVKVGPWKWDLSARSPLDPSQTISDEERLVILRMLQEKKISLDEAEKLLAALEGK